MNDSSDKINRDRQRILDAQKKGGLATAFCYTRLSGPGWLQSAITLGGGSLAGSLYLGVLGGSSLLWVQPLFMILGIIMLSAIGYVTMSTGERPFRAINQYVSPLAGWAWALATMAANMVWCLPQFSLANSVFEQNLASGLYAESGLGPSGGKLLVACAILLATVLITWSYGSGHWGVRLYEFMLKLMVAGIVLCFVWVVYYLTTQGQINWSEIAIGFVPDPRLIFEPAAGYQTAIDNVAPEHQAFWKNYLVRQQLDKIAAAAATAVGINMTFLFPYSILKRGWTREFRGLQVFDLSTGMLIPFVAATSCVVIAAGAAFHTKPIPGLVREEAANRMAPTVKELKQFRSIMSARLKQSKTTEEWNFLSSSDEDLNATIEQLPIAERRLAAMLVNRDANRLAQALAPLGSAGDNDAISNQTAAQKTSGVRAADLVFGLGVVGMTMSSITLLMLISGFVICEVFNLPTTGWPFRLACLPAAVGVLGPFVWNRPGFELAVPTSVFGLILLPIAYISFFLLMNQRRLLKDQLPRGAKRIVWNLLMGVATLVATASSIYMVWQKLM